MQKLGKHLQMVYTYIFVFVSSRRTLPFDIWPSFPVTTWTL